MSLDQHHKEAGRFEDDANSPHDDDHGAAQDLSLQSLGYKPELHRNRSLSTILFQSLAIAAVPYGEGSALNSAIIGGGQLPLFVGWIMVCILDQCVAMSLSELASKYPTSGGPYFWSHALANGGASRKLLSFITGWTWLVGNWTIALSVNFGIASLIAGTATIYHPDWVASAWQLLLIFYAVCLSTFLICALGNRVLPSIDTIASIWNLITILVVFIALSVVAGAGRHPAAEALAIFDSTLSGWGTFGFFIGILPAAYTYSAIGMVSSMAEEVREPDIELPKAMSLCIPISGVAGLFFILPICFTLPPLEAILNAPAAQGLPFIFHTVMKTEGGGLALMLFVLVVALFCSISISTAASRCTWAFARDKALPFSGFFSQLRNEVPVNALGLVTLVQMLLGLINLGSSSTFTAFASAGVIGLAASYAIPISISMLNGRRKIAGARFGWPAPVGWTVNAISVLWIVFQLILFSMPTAIPVTIATMNYASVVVVGFMFFSFVYYIIFARRVYHGPPKSDGL